jgi:hypothetical protein
MMPVVDESGSTYFELGILDKVENLYPDYLKDIECGDLSRPGVASERYFSDVLSEHAQLQHQLWAQQYRQHWYKRYLTACRVRALENTA